MPTRKNEFAPTPPMGWNSWDCYGASVTEEEVRGNADYIAKYLKPYGWEYVVGVHGGFLGVSSVRPAGDG